MNPEDYVSERPHPSLPVVEASLYMERSGKGSRERAEKLLLPPERPFSVEDAVEAYAYENSLCEVQIEHDLTIEQLIRTRKSESYRFFADAFLTGQVAVEGLEGQIRQNQSSEDVYAWLAQSALDKTLTPAQFREMSRQSEAYYKAEMKQAVLQGERPKNTVFDVMNIVIEPDKALYYAVADQNARAFLASERKIYPAESLGLDGAKRAFVDIYTKRINGMVANDIKVLESLIQQSQLIHDDETVVDAYRAIPASLQKAVSNEDARRILNKRLDYIVNGIGYDDHGHASAVDKDVFTSERAQATDKETVYSPDERERLRNFKMSKEEINQLFVSILAEANILSAEDASTWEPKRGHRAADDLYQVVFHPTKDTLAVDGTDGVIKTPNVARSVYDIMTIGVHELTHINQTRADRMLGATLRIGALKGRRVSMLRETGANIVQRELETKLFGVSKPVAYAYARALRCFEAGGDIFDATLAFYEEKTTSNYTVSKVDAATEATDRVLRLGMRGANSQPMSYAEENIMNKELADAPAEVRQRATKITTLDLDDQLRLHTYGLLPEVADDEIDWTPLLLKHIEPYINKALSESQE